MKRWEGVLVSFASYLISRFSSISEDVEWRDFYRIQKSQASNISIDVDILFPISSGQVRGTDKAVSALQIFLLNVVKLDGSTCMSGEDV